jgi:hypothetical protein
MAASHLENNVKVAGMAFDESYHPVCYQGRGATFALTAKARGFNYSADTKGTGTRRDRAAKGKTDR